jgi:predicted ABC-type ATPase
MTASSKKIVILAGPNGAGKTTFAREFLPDEAQCPTFINADLIALGLSPFDPERAAVRAGRLMLELMNERVANGESFAFETTLASRSFARSIPKWRADGYTVELLFLSLPSADFAVARVAERVSQGGHGVPEAVVRRRFEAGRINFETVYKGLVDGWALYDSSGDVPRLLDWSD